MPNMCFTLTNTIYVIDLFIYLHLILKKKVSDHPFSRLHQAAVPDTPPPPYMFIEMSLKIGFGKLEGHSLLV